MRSLGREFVKILFQRRNYVGWAGLLAVAVTKARLEERALAAQYGSEDEEDRARRANLDQLVAAAAEATERGLDLRGFLDEVALLTDADMRREGDAVQLSTLHAAKGLEFAAVFLVGMEDGLLPLRREGNGEADEEEERRLAYVGMTRAQRRLFLTFARVRRVNGQLLSGRPSPSAFRPSRSVMFRGSRSAWR